MLCGPRQTSTVYVSAVSGWEISVKVRLGKWLEAAILLPGLADKFAAARMNLLPLTLQQAERGSSHAATHKDLLDRLLAAQALDLDLAIGTVDPAFTALGCRVA